MSIFNLRRRKKPEELAKILTEKIANYNTSLLDFLEGYYNILKNIVMFS